MYKILSESTVLDNVTKQYNNNNNIKIKMIYKVKRILNLIMKTI